MRLSFSYLMIPVLFCCACSANRAEKQAMATYAATADSTTFSNDMSRITSTSRKRVKSADVRCRVASVFASTSALEQLVTRSGGVVEESNLQNESVEQYRLPYSADSVKRVQLYTPVANLTLRVPVDSLDMVVRALTSTAVYIDHRVVKDQDMTLKYLANAMKNEQQENSAGKAVAPSKKGNTLDIAEYNDQRGEQAVDRRISNLTILDDVAYSTFTVQLFQPEVADVQIVVNPAKMSRAGFGTELAGALRGGADIFRNILLFFVELWPFLLIGAAGWIGYRKLLLRKG
ncbi:uncharacterized protein DUF4349 [Chitinophaga polysaccharea]|uniref:Uncharacterized protein DUF4349 n=2 Tax=Chitinophaga polysaccharea TaxID=1293035 RepID=A0A561PNX5_9BACT|nr:uncharacterized protein DUF4349 [Chitinophaga polysaccharea]